LKGDTLLKRLKNNDGKAFEELFRMHFNALLNYANFYIGCRQLAEDLVHDVFYRIWETRSKITIHTSIKSYLYKSVHNNCIQYLRHLKVVKKHQKDQESKLEEALLLNRLYFETGLSKLLEKEINDLVEESISRLPSKTRDIYVMSRKNYKKNSEIARNLNVTEKTVEYHMTQALSLLRVELKDYLPFLILFCIPGLL
jgi:RNA polymerase sigma-70 factor, ECF subfamily